MSDPAHHGGAAPRPVAGWDELAFRAWAASPYSFAAIAQRRRFAQCYHAFQAWLKQFGTPTFDLREIESGGLRTPVAEAVESDTGFCALRAFRASSHRDKPPRRILLCAPLAGHHAMLLRDMVIGLVADADVFVTDWADARDVPVARGRFGLDDCVRTLEQFIVQLGASDLHIVAVCQATVPALAAVARRAQRGGQEPRTLTLLGGPIDARLAPTALERVAATLSPTWLDASAIGVVPEGYAGAGRRVYPGFLQYPTLVAAQPDRQLSLLMGWLCRGSTESERAREIERSMAQFSSVLDMTAEFFLDTLRVVFQQMALAKGRWQLAGELVRPGCLRETRLLTIEAARDDICGAGQTHAANGLCEGLPVSARHDITVPDADHYDLFSGQRWRDTVCPALLDWMEQADRTHATAR
ncbi:poly(3-hydroxybutyrate) depolymerase [Cupriavidus gilardii J11]|uniref:Poly(3-hydroxybutyrate) depolymerase n=1 Tax=Cupriavidus gilardii J11 TaxID=936133 RepID=A0A562B2N9_9BURK|nr:polyhydroxyalkanoate depolymerase [Cupriavidus gilardii]TWG79309.1 poly(3-hydroxybutyrate) depolymerase [Cupriavidus gilardii J11]